MTFPDYFRTAEVNGIRLNVAEAGTGPLVIMCHGFPDLSCTWRHQFRALVDAGYRVIAPDQRGYGRSDHPSEIEAYDILQLTDDLLAILDQAGEERAVFIGHDWGALLTWAIAGRAPDRVAGVAGLSVPFTPRPPVPPLRRFKELADDGFFYIVYFQQPGVAEAELERDVPTSLRRLLANVNGDTSGESLSALLGPDDGRGLVDRLPEVVRLPDWFTQDDLDYYSAEFTRTGFSGGLNWYRNMDRNWTLTADFADKPITPPALFIAGASDPILTLTAPSSMADRVEDLRGTVLISGAGHWVHLERPTAVNSALLSFLADIT
ncbi:alpha/beta hydrolase [Nocardia vinacea]|uniref:alpha/beta fold hydrolase n=1 Tax=Nocardia vinacea TaxID=96468 RepID=UPI0033F38C8C